MSVSTIYFLALVFSQSCFLQDGHFDKADRAFNSIEMAWRSASGEDRSDIQEVIPVFYYLPDFLTNSNMFVLGEWYSGWEYLTDQLPSTAFVLNTCAMEVSYLANSFHIYVFGFDKQHIKHGNTNMEKTPGYEANTIAYVVY